ncbi:NADP-dependent oxidoreductase [Demequina oxidasica]|uniref:NADP-dependent oxidoreductase n=1 Tax=Demequina oxidasica TaxID=676199 RepID=UPI0007845038|nr:NADP-dependent oxidoreductase [Demequina oxidasica]
MKAITYAQFGNTEVFELTEVADPHPGPDSIVVEVKAAGINPVDYKVREGYLAGLIDTQFPVVPGWDVAGVVAQVGLDTPEFQVGDEVYAYARKDSIGGGTLAELVAVPVRTAAHKPSSIGFEQAAAVPLAGLTALQTVRRAGVASGQTVLVHGAAGGVGSFAVQLALHAGATVVGTASATNHDYLRDLGVTPIEYGDGLVERALAQSPAGYDIILDYAGGASLDHTSELLTKGGVVASVADPRAATEFGGHYVWVRPDSTDLEELAELIDDGALKVEVANTFALADTADAYAELEGGHVRGKIVVVP